MAKLTPNPSHLWEVWLQKLHGIEDPSRNYFRLELLDLLTRTDIPDSQSFINRLGTVLCHCLQVGEVLIVDKDQTRILYQDKTGKSRYLIKNLHKLVEGDCQTLQIRQFTRPKTLLSNRPAIKFVAQLPLTDLVDQPLLLLVIGDKTLPADDRHFLQFVANLLSLHIQNTALNKDLVREKRLLELLTQHINEGLLLISAEREIKIWNRPLQRITGYTLKDSREKNIEDLLVFREESNWLSTLLDIYRDSDQNGFFYDRQIITKAKQLRWISISGSFLRDDQKNISQIIAIVRDISKEKQLEQRKNEFISIATHELRTPITAIKGYLSLLQNNQESFSDKQRQYLDYAYRATERLVGLAEDLLQVIRLDEDRMNFSLQPVELSKVIEKVASDFSDKIRRKGLELNLTLPPFSTTIIADPLRLEQVFSNLVDNAIKYTTHGSISIAFEHFSERVTHEDKVSVIIKDTGIGIDSKDLEDVFHKFHRSERAANLREPGAGLGLYIAKTFIEKQNGKISLKSRPKRGSTFAVTFTTIMTNPDLSTMIPLENPKDSHTKPLARKNKTSTMRRPK